MRRNQRKPADAFKRISALMMIIVMTVTAAGCDQITGGREPANASEQLQDAQGIQEETAESDIENLLETVTTDISDETGTSNNEDALDTQSEHPLTDDFPEGSAGMDAGTLELVDDFIESQVEYGFSGAQLVVIKDGQLVKDKAYGCVNGYRQDLSRIMPGDTEYKKVTTDTLFDLASNTKMYAVNYALQYLVTQGKVDLDTKIADVIGQQFVDDTIDITYPDYVNPGLETNKSWKSSLTIRDILRHQGGFAASPHYDNDRFDQKIQKLTDIDGINILYSGSDGSMETRENTLEGICRTPLMYEPGTKTLYSDVDYMLLDFVIEKITGERLDDFCSRTFWEPMGLKHICYRPLDNGFGKEDCAAEELNGNTRDGNVTFKGVRTDTIQGEVHDEQAYYSMAGVSGHAGLFSNAEDLAKLAYLMMDGTYSGKEYFSKDVIDEFTTPYGNDDSWGLGWWRQGSGKDRSRYFSESAPADTFGHEGWTGTLTMIDPDNKMVIVLLTNRKNSPVMVNGTKLNEFYSDDFLLGGFGTVPQLIYDSFMKNSEQVDNELCDIASSQFDKAKKRVGRYNEEPYIDNAASCEDMLITRAEKQNGNASAALKECAQKGCDSLSGIAADGVKSEAQEERLNGYIKDFETRISKL